MHQPSPLEEVSRLLRHLQRRRQNAPKITPLADVTIEASFPYTRAIPTCNDCLDGALTPTFVKSNVDVEKAGIYHTQWVCGDKHGNKDFYSQKVTVKDTLKPVIGLKLGADVIHSTTASDQGLKAGLNGHVSKTNFVNPLYNYKFMEQVSGVNAWALAGIAAAVAGVAILAMGGKRNSELEVLI